MKTALTAVAHSHIDSEPKYEHQLINLTFLKNLFKINAQVNHRLTVCGKPVTTQVM